MSFFQYPDWGRGEDEAAMSAGVKAFRTPLGEYLGAQVREGFWASIPGQAIAQTNRLAASDEGEKPLTAEEWRASPHFRATIPFDERMTPSRARATAETFDENAYRRWLIDQREAGALDGTLGFIAGIAGSAPDPVNFIPWAGPAFRAARVARYGQIGGRAAAGAFEGAVGAAVAQPFLVTSRNQFGDDVGFADVVTDIAFSAFAGAAIGGGVGIWKRFRGEAAGPEDLRVTPRDTTADPIPDVPRQNAALYALDSAARDVAAGRAVDVDPRIAAEMASVRESVADGRVYDRGEFADGQTRHKDEIPTFLAQHVDGKPAGAKVPQAAFEVDQVSPSARAILDRVAPEFGALPDRLYISGKVLKHIDERMRPEAVQRMSDVVRSPDYVLPNPTAEKPWARPWLVKQLDNANAVIVEVRANGRGIDVVTVIAPVDASRLSKAQARAEKLGMKIEDLKVTGPEGRTLPSSLLAPPADGASRGLRLSDGRPSDGNMPQSARPVNFTTAAPDALPADPAPARASEPRAEVTESALADLDRADALAAAGRLTEADAAALKAARDELTRAEAYDRAAPAAAFCFRG